MAVDFGARQQGDVKIIKVYTSGRDEIIDYQTVVKNFATVAGNDAKLLLDLSSLTELPPKLLEAFARASLQARGRFAMLAVANPSLSLYQPLQRENYHKHVPIYHTTGAALAEFAKIRSRPESASEYNQINKALIQAGMESFPQGLRAFFGPLPVTGTAANAITAYS